MGEVLRQVEQSETFREFLRSKVPNGPDGSGCAPNCKWILEDLELNGKLTGWPLDSFGKPEYPIDAKLIHVILELGDIPPDDTDDPDDLASVVAHLLEI